MLVTNFIFWIAEIGCVVVSADIWIAPNLCLSDDWWWYVATHTDVSGDDMLLLILMCLVTGDDMLTLTLFLFQISSVACLACLCSSGTVKVGLFMLPLIGRLRLMMFVTVFSLLVTCLFIFLDISHIVYFFPFNWGKLVSGMVLFCWLVSLLLKLLVLCNISLKGLAMSWMSGVYVLAGTFISSLPLCPACCTVIPDLYTLYPNGSLAYSALMFGNTRSLFHCTYLSVASVRTGIHLVHLGLLPCGWSSQIVNARNSMSMLSVCFKHMVLGMMLSLPGCVYLPWKHNIVS